jgi:hypothetical protein
MNIINRFINIMAKILFAVLLIIFSNWFQNRLNAGSYRFLHVINML